MPWYLRCLETLQFVWCMSSRSEAAALRVWIKCKYVASTAMNYKVPPKCLDTIFETLPTNVHDILYWYWIWLCIMYVFCYSIQYTVYKIQYTVYSIHNAHMFSETRSNGLYTQVHQNIMNSQVTTCVSFGLIVCNNTRVPNAKCFFVVCLYCSL